MFDFYCETSPNVTHYLQGKAASFRSGYFATSDEQLAQALLAMAEELNLIPGEWARGGQPAAQGEEMSVPVSPVSANPRPERLRRRR